MKRQKKKKKKQKPILAPTKCINCGEKGAHFIGPSFGDKGFFICEKILTKLEKWMDEKGFDTVKQFRGKVSRSYEGNPAAFERMQFMKYFSEIR